MKTILSNETIDDVINDDTGKIEIGDTVTVSNGNDSKNGKDVKVLGKGESSINENYLNNGIGLNEW